jgi:hydroxymethylglutaryl-CoA reductase (NADPH)
MDSRLTFREIATGATSMNTGRSLGNRPQAATADATEPALFEIAKRWKRLGSASAKSEIFDQKARDNVCLFANNIENYIGTVSTPVGIAGPIRINGAAGSREYCVPLATTEAALVASYNRGARLVSAAGGCNVRVVDEGVSRTPMFAFETIVEAEQFATFVIANRARMTAVVPSTTQFGKLKNVRTIIEGNHVYLDLRYTTGDAAGQNMVTFASDAICKCLIEHAPVAPRFWFLEANLSGDKKAASQGLADVRGKRVVADIVVPGTLVKRVLHTSPLRMSEYWCAGALGGVMSGTTGVQGHFANGLAALYLACGQDIACVAESAIGITRMEVNDDADLYASVTLPNIIVGTVGGGTGLPSARACLDILGLAGSGHSEAFAEVCAGIVLAGELSIIGAFCSGDFAAAHRSLSRGGTMQRSRDHD